MKAKVDGPNIILTKRNGNIASFGVGSTTASALECIVNEMWGDEKEKVKTIPLEDMPCDPDARFIILKCEYSPHKERDDVYTGLYIKGIDEGDEYLNCWNVEMGQVEEIDRHTPIHIIERKTGEE